MPLHRVWLGNIKIRKCKVLLDIIKFWWWQICILQIWKVSWNWTNHQKSMPWTKSFMKVGLLPWLMHCGLCSDLTSTSPSALSFSPWQEWASASSLESIAVGLEVFMFPFRSRWPCKQTSVFPLHTDAIKGEVRAALFTAFDGGCSLEPLYGVH